MPDPEASREPDGAVRTAAEAPVQVGIQAVSFAVAVVGVPGADMERDVERGTPAPALPTRSRPIEGEDFAAMRREQGASDLLRAAEAAVAETRPDDDQLGLVHGDLWCGSTLWDGDKLTAVLDWDCAGVGPAGIDLGSLRCDAAWRHGVKSAEHILPGWEAEAGRPARDLPYCDAVAALASPPDMGWFQMEMTGQGRTDLTCEVMLERRDAFLDAALSRLSVSR